MRTAKREARITSRPRWSPWDRGLLSRRGLSLQAHPARPARALRGRGGMCFLTFTLEMAPTTLLEQMVCPHVGSTARD